MHPALEPRGPPGNQASMAGDSTLASPTTTTSAITRTPKLISDARLLGGAACSSAVVTSPADVTVKVDLDGIEDRVLQVSVPAGNYRNLQSVGGTVYYIRMSSSSPA